MESARKVVPEKRSARRAAKRSYVRPELTVHGDVDKITEVLLRARVNAITGTGLGGDDGEGSDRNSKENFAPVDGRGVLERLAAVPVESWNYKGESPEVRHMGPMAQDFFRAFGLGGDDKRIHNIDAAGVALASIQALYRMVLEGEAEVRDLRRQVEELRREAAQLAAELSAAGG